MVMPIDLVLVRHGESEGNLAHLRAADGDLSAFENCHFQNRHSSLWRLTDKGREQARITGEWLKENLGQFDSFYCSEFVRAMETAALLHLPNAQWRTSLYIRERDWGKLDLLSHQQRKLLYADDLERRRRDSFFFQPPDGESMANVCLRVSRLINTLHRQDSDKRVVIVCHGEILWTFRVIIERMSQSTYRELDTNRDVKNKIHNCQVLHYTRRNPVTGKLSGFLSHFRSVLPSDMSLSPNEWVPICTHTYKTNQELLQEVEAIPRILNNDSPFPLPNNFMDSVHGKHHQPIVANEMDQEDHEERDEERREEKVVFL